MSDYGKRERDQDTRWLLDACEATVLLCAGVVLTFVRAVAGAVHALRG